jgi:hypothetical protein
MFEAPFLFLGTGRYICPDVTPEADLAPTVLKFLKEGEEEEEDNRNAKRGEAEQSTLEIHPEDKGEAEEKDEVEEEPANKPIGDLPGVEMTEADKLLLKVYGDYVHQNDGTHLDGGIADDKVWQKRWIDLAILPTQRYAAPKGAVGKRFVTLLATELAGIVQRKWNSERFLVFQSVILQKAKGVRGSGAIRARITNRLNSWEEGKFDMLVQDSERSALSQLSRLQGNVTREQREKTYARLVLQGKVRAAVRYVTEREKGGCASSQ